MRNNFDEFVYMGQTENGSHRCPDEKTGALVLWRTKDENRIL